MCVDNSVFAACAPSAPVLSSSSRFRPPPRVPACLRDRAYALRARLPALPSPHRHRHHPSCWRCQSFLLACLEMAHPAHHSALLPCSVRVPFVAALAASRALPSIVHRCLASTGAPRCGLRCFHYAVLLFWLVFVPGPAPCAPTRPLAVRVSPAVSSSRPRAPPSVPRLLASSVRALAGLRMRRGRPASSVPLRLQVAGLCRLRPHSSPGLALRCRMPLRC